MRKVINEHKSSELYQTAVIADEYDRCRNRTIMQHEKTLHTVTGKTIRDEWSESKARTPVPGWTAEPSTHTTQNGGRRVIECPKFRPG